PRLVRDRRHRRDGGGLREAQGVERGAVGADGAEHRLGGGRLPEEGAQPRGMVGNLFFYHPERALLPQEVRQALGGLDGGGDRELPERHQEPNSFFIRSTKDSASGVPPSSPLARWNSSRSSR